MGLIPGFNGGGGLVGRGLSAVDTGVDAWRAFTGTIVRDLVRSHPDDELAERDPEYIRRTNAASLALARAYFRPVIRGLDKIPADGPVLLVGNHSGGTWIADTFVFSFAFYDHFGPDRAFHQLAHDVAVKLPGAGALIRKNGTVSASHDNARRALSNGAAVLVYPGGDIDSYRPSWHSHKVEFGGRKGFIQLALDAQVRIVPVVAIGGQETALFLTRGQRVARFLGMDEKLRIKVFPIVIGPPYGLTVLDLPFRFPLPAQITIQVMDPVDLNERFGEDPDHDEVYEEIVGDMQETLDELAQERTLPILG